MRVYARARTHARENTRTRIRESEFHTPATRAGIHESNFRYPDTRIQLRVFQLALAGSGIGIHELNFVLSIYEPGIMQFTSGIPASMVRG